LSKAGSENLRLLEKYYRDEAENMAAFAARILGDTSLAEVAVQETFLTALNNLNKLTASPKPVGWLYITLRNIIKHIQRDRQEQLRRFVAMEEVGEDKIFAEDSNVHELIMTAASCTNADMKLLYEFYVEGYSLRELAEKYGISLGACKMRIRRAKDRARK